MWDIAHKIQQLQVGYRLELLLDRKTNGPWQSGAPLLLPESSETWWLLLFQVKSEPRLLLLYHMHIIKSLTQTVAGPGNEKP